jgi:alkylation response protein AidB-like acyl-CoA dehydrogenase
VVRGGANATSPSTGPTWRDQWPALAELGLPALCVPESLGGLGWQVEVAVGAARVFGSTLHGVPFAGLMAAGHALSSAATSDEQVGELLAEVLSGEAICAFGFLEPGATTAKGVDGVPSVDAVVLADRRTGQGRLVRPPPISPSDRALDEFDPSRRCRDVAVGPDGGHQLGADPVVLDLFALLLAADAVGVVEQELERTVAYASERQAFGRAIGGFQAVQHRLADHAVRLRGMSLLVAEAARALGAGEPDAHRRVLVAQGSVTGAAPHLLHDLVQLTGAIGFTWEYGLHLAERRVHQDLRLVGGARSVRDGLAEIERWTVAG